MISKMEVQMARNEQDQTTDTIPAITENKEIKSLIYVAREQQVMLESDLPGMVADLLNRLRMV